MGGVVGRDVTHGSHAVPPCRLTARRSRQSRRRPRLGPLIPIEGPRRGGGRKATPYEFGTALFHVRFNALLYGFGNSYEVLG